MKTVLRLGLVSATTLNLCQSGLAQDSLNDLNNLSKSNNLNNIGSPDKKLNDAGGEILDGDELNLEGAKKFENTQLNFKNDATNSLSNLQPDVKNNSANAKQNTTRLSPPPPEAAFEAPPEAPPEAAFEAPPVAPPEAAFEAPQVAPPEAAFEAPPEAAFEAKQVSDREKPRQLKRAERKKARLEIIKKMAESIPALRPGEAPLEYTVQPGDTLWDISDQLLDDPLWWPRLWMLNPEVTNPDKIEPGIRLVFYPSSAEKAPELLVQDSGDPLSAPAKVDVALLQTFRMDVRRWSGKNGELISPDNLPSDQNLLVIGEPQFSSQYMFRLPGFILSSEPPFEGEIVSSPNSPLLTGQGQHLIARFDRTPTPGERFLVVRESPLLSGLAHQPFSGILFSHTGSVGVVRSTQNGYAVMVAEDASSQIAPNDKLIPARRNIYVPLDQFSSGRLNRAPALVVATENGQYQSAGRGNAIYLQSMDGGQNPFQVGDDVELFMPLGSSFGMDDEVTPREKVGVARIVDTTPDAAVGVIMQSTREIMTGASTFMNLFSE